MTVMNLEPGNVYLLHKRNKYLLDEVHILQKTKTSYQLKFGVDKPEVWDLITNIESNYILIEHLYNKVEREKELNKMKDDFTNRINNRFPEGCIYSAEIKFLQSMIKELLEKRPEIRHRDTGPIQFSYTEQELFISFTDNEDMQYGYALDAAKKLFIDLSNCIAGLQNKQKSLDSKFDVDSNTYTGKGFKMGYKRGDIIKQKIITKIKGYHIDYGLKIGWSHRISNSTFEGEWIDEKLQEASFNDLQEFLTKIEVRLPRILFGQSFAPHIIESITLKKKEPVIVISGQNIVLSLDPREFKVRQHSGKLLITCEHSAAADLIHTLQRAL